METLKQNPVASSPATRLASTVAKGAAFVVGDGAQSAARLDATQKFLTISSNAKLVGTGTVATTINVLPGGSNQPLSAANAAPAPWLSQIPLAGNGAVLTFTNTASGQMGFFRVLTH